GAIMTHRLRDRELLRKRKAEALKKDSAHWILREQKSKQQRRGKASRRGWGRQPVMKPSVEPEPEPDPQPGPQEEAEPALAKPALPKPAPPEPAYQEQLPVLTIQDLVNEMQPGELEVELAARSQDPIGEEELLQLAEAEIPEALNTALENEYQDSEYNTHLF
ncbi:HEMGN protein, partial [Atlantisia rogersi]|nr:HEMGN protein [Atlantisia rogersi]